MLTFISHFFIVLTLALWPAGSWKKEDVKKSSYEMPASSKNFTHVRVFLMGGLQEVEIKTFSPYVVKDKNYKVLFKGDQLRGGTKIRAIPEGIQFGTQTLRNLPVHLESQGEGWTIRGRTYRYSIEIWEDEKGKLLLVNEIPIEDYLKSVLPSEMSAEWPLEALKAQAIAARTYALFKMIENQANQFDVRSDVISQAYKGKTMEHLASTRAVRETQGQVLSHQGKLFLAFFHSTCGGHTANIASLWNMQEHPSLKGVECDFCRLSRHFRWKSEILLSDVEKKLKGAGYSVSGLKEISISDKDKSGRAKMIAYEDSKGTKKIIAGDFRFITGPDKIKSTFIENISIKNKKILIRGRGWGHGVGLCQYGAKRLGELGYVARQILRYYYPDSELTQFWPHNQYL